MARASASRHVGTHLLSAEVVPQPSRLPGEALASHAHMLEESENSSNPCERKAGRQPGGAAHARELSSMAELTLNRELLTEHSMYTSKAHHLE